MSNSIDNQFIRASRKKLRFITNKGSLQVEDLWDLSLTSLDLLAVDLDEKVQKLGRKSFLTATVRDTNDLQLQFDLVKFVIDTKVAEKEAAKERDSKEARKSFLKDLLEKKQLNALEGLSEAEIQAQIAALDESAPEKAGA